MLTGLALVPSAATARCRVGPTGRQGRRRSVAVFAGELTPEQQQVALQRQLAKSASKSDKPAPSSSEGSLEERQAEVRNWISNWRNATQAAAAPVDPVDDLAQRQAAARAWIKPWLEGAARSKSKAVQAELKDRVSMMPSDSEQTALRRLLYGGSGSYEEEEKAAPAQEGAPAAAAAASPATGPKTFEDGSLLFTADMLQAVSYEDVLTA